MDIPAVPLERVLRRVDHIWGPEMAPHHLLFGMSGSGKTTLIKSLLGLCRDDRVLILDPKPAADPVWDGPPGEPYQWGKPVTAITPMFGYAGEAGGGPASMWYRLTGGPDRADTARRFGAALAIVAAEGHTVLILDDVRETCRQLRLAESVDSVMNLGRSASVCAILSATETSYVSGRGQGGMVWIGHTTGLSAAKAGAELLGWRGRERQDTCAGLAPHQWIFSEDQPGHAGPCIVTDEPRQQIPGRLNG
jgi:energy-coupling factor transporter ATP-binding protein EcfA2